MSRRAVLLGVLVYLTLDLSVAEMPGAFVFDPVDSVETIHAARVRGAESLIAMPASTAVASATSASPPAVRPAAVPAAREGRAPRVVSRLPRAALVPALSEDPH